jgi:hypothetical protein
MSELVEICGLQFEEMANGTLLWYIAEGTTVGAIKLTPMSDEWSINLFIGTTSAGGGISEFRHKNNTITLGVPDKESLLRETIRAHVDMLPSAVFSQVVKSWL